MAADSDNLTLIPAINRNLFYTYCAEVKNKWSYISTPALYFYAAGKDNVASTAPRREECCLSVTNLICVRLIGLAGLNAMKRAETGCLRQWDGYVMTVSNRKNKSQRHGPRLPFRHFTAYVPSFSCLWIRRRIFKVSVAYQRVGVGWGLPGCNPALKAKLKKEL
jgi:hypothetical protein